MLFWNFFIPANSIVTLKLQTDHMNMHSIDSRFTFHSGISKKQNKWMERFGLHRHAISVLDTRRIKTPGGGPYSTRWKHRLHKAHLRLTTFLHIWHNYTLFRAVRPSKRETVASPTDSYWITSANLLRNNKAIKLYLSNTTYNFIKTTYGCKHYCKQHKK